MAELGSVFEDEGEGPRGPDLRVTVEVPKAALGGCLRAPVPSRIAADGDLVERALAPGQDAESVELHLPAALEPRTMLRLRGQGGVHPEGSPGDLLVLVELVDRPPRAGEVITRSPPAVVEDAAVTEHDGESVNDVTWWVLLALALAGGGALALLAL